MIESVSGKTKAEKIEAPLIALINERPFASAQFYADKLRVGLWIVQDVFKRWSKKQGARSPLWIIRKRAVDDCAAANPRFSTDELAKELGATNVVVGMTYRKFETKRQTSDRIRRDYERQKELRKIRYRARHSLEEKNKRYLYARDPDKWREILENTKATLKKYPLRTLSDIAHETGANESILKRARDELQEEGWYRDLEREIVLEEYIEAHPNATLSDAAKYFDVDENVIYRTAGSWRLNPSSSRWNTQPDLGYNESIEDYELEQRVTLPPEWYVCEMEKRGTLGVKLPPDEFERYLKLYQRRKRIGPARISLESEGIVVK